MAKETGTGAASGIAADAVGTAVTIAVAATPAASAAPIAGTAASIAVGYATDLGCRKADQYMQDRKKVADLPSQTEGHVRIIPALN